MSPSSSALTNRPLAAAVLSLGVPGAGQLYLGARNVAISIFATAVMMAFLVWFCLDNFHVGEVTPGGITTSWLWLLSLAFWIWNVIDANRRARGKGTPRLLAFGIPVLLIYI